jgi:xanthosine utilization system XapX-like protein
MTVLRLIEILSMFFALGAAFFVAIEYAILVPTKNNPGAVRLLSLLWIVVGVLGLSVARIVFGEYPLREIITTAGLYAFGLALVWIGWAVWHDQIEGAKRYRENHPQKEDQL